MMGQPIQQGPGQLFAAEHLRPWGKVQIGGQDEGLPLIAPGRHLEEELGSLFRERHVADLVDDQQVHLGQTPLQVREPEAGLGFGQQVDEAGRSKEPHLVARCKVPERMASISRADSSSLKTTISSRGCSCHSRRRRWSR